MQHPHTMVRIRDIDESLDFFCGKPAMRETRRMENEQGRFTPIFLAANDEALAPVEPWVSMQNTGTW